MRKSELLSKPVKQSTPNRHSEITVTERCPDCNAVLEQYDDETIGLCVVVLATYIHREPSLATPMLLESLIAVSRIASSSPYMWQMETNVMVPGNSLSISRQFLRCCLHQLAPNGIFPMLFQSSFDDYQFLKTIAAALVDFPELRCHAAIHYLLEGLNGTWKLSTDNIHQLLDNLATYMNSVSLETSATMWANILNQFDILFHHLTEILPVPCDMTSVMKIITTLLKVNGINNAKHILEPFSKLLSIAVTNCSFHLHQLLDICSLCNRVFSRTNMKGACNSLNEDTLGSLVKSGIAQFVAIEITRGNSSDNRAIARYLPWCYHPPSTTQQGPKEFTECIGHIRLLSWLLIGTLTHTAMTEGAGCITCMPFPLDARTFIAEHV